MLDALAQAIAAGDHGDVPIGAVAVHDGGSSPRPTTSAS